MECRSKALLQLKDPEDSEKSAGKIVCLDVRHWILSVYSTWTYTLQVELSLSLSLSAFLPLSLPLSASLPPSPSLAGSSAAPP
eukprot:2527647-Rhodomonas_salina.1